MSMIEKFSRTFVLAAALILSASVALAQNNDADPFPQPAALKPDVDFWLAIFTRHSSSEGLLHDNRNLAVIYEAVPVPKDGSRRQRQRAYESRRNHYRSILETLGGGKRTGLTDDEQRVLDLWPADVSNRELTAAARQIRFQLGLSDRFRQGLIRAGRWRAHVEAEFARLGVPAELAALPHVESSYNPNARSHVGASGIWQFTRSTGRRFLRVDHVLDERNDPFLATTAAAKLLAYNYSIAGNWPMAITAYNHGLAGARRAMREFGDEAYVDILRRYKGRAFGFASRNFYVAFLAAKEVDQNPEKYFPGLVPDSPVSYTTVRLPSFVPLQDFLQSANVDADEFRAHNLALQSTVWQGSKHLPREFDLRIPTSSVSVSPDALIASLPAASLHDQQLPDLFHTVARGDTLSDIADFYKTRVSTLVALNNLTSRHRIRAGQRIRLPAAGPAPAIVAAVENVAPEPSADASSVPPADQQAVAASIDREESAASGGKVDADIIIAKAPEEEAAPVPDATAGADDGEDADNEQESVTVALLSDPSDYTVSDDGTIEVHPLETLGHYADWLGIRTQRLRDINGLAFRTPVAVGQRIKLELGEDGAERFVDLRTRYHREQQDMFFKNHTITGITEHEVRAGESVWVLSLRRYGVPIWLFRQYNPELDLHRVRRGTRLKLPLLTSNDAA